MNKNPDIIYESFCQLDSLLEGIQEIQKIHFKEMRAYMDAMEHALIAIDSLRKNFIAPIINKYPGYQKSSSSDSLPGAGGEGTTGIIYNAPNIKVYKTPVSADDCKVSLVEGEDSMTISVPEDIAKRISAREDQLRAVINHYLREEKTIASEGEHNVLTYETILSISDILDVNLHEAEILVKLLVLQGIESGDYDAH